MYHIIFTLFYNTGDQQSSIHAMVANSNPIFIYHIYNERDILNGLLYSENYFTLSAGITCYRNISREFICICVILAHFHNIFSLCAHFNATIDTKNRSLYLEFICYRRSNRYGSLFIPRLFSDLLRFY